MSSEDVGPDESSEEFVARLEPANINRISFLATDYLNHFNEAIMLLELVPDMPDMLAEARDWQPKSYKAHFLDSDFTEKDLACEAYDHAPERYRIPFDLTSRALDRQIAKAIETADLTISRGETARLGQVMAESCEAIRELICVAGGIINGRDTHPVQEVQGEAAEETDHVVMAQQEIDAMFDDGEAPPSDQAAAEGSPDETETPVASCEPATEAGEPVEGAEVPLSQADIDALFD